MTPLRKHARPSRISRSIASGVLGVIVVGVVAVGVGFGVASTTGVLDWDRVKQARDTGRFGGTPTIPAEFEAVIAEAAQRCPAIPSRILAAQIAVESSWRVDAVSPAGAQGIAQFMPSTWNQFGLDANGDGVADVWDPVDAIHSAAALNCVNRDLVANVPGTPLHNVLAAYNAGHGAVRKYDGIPPFPETENYVQRVLDLATRLPVPASSNANP